MKHYRVEIRQGANVIATDTTDFEQAYKLYDKADDFCAISKKAYCQLIDLDTAEIIEWCDWVE